MLRYVSILLVLVSLSPCIYAQESEQTLGEIVSIVEDNLDKLGGNTLAVFPLSYFDGIKSVEGALYSQRIVTMLNDHGKVRVVDRALLDKVMEEQKLGASGLVNPASAAQIGKLLGARGILSGTVTDLGELLELHVRLVSVETSEIVVSFKGKTRKTIKTFINPLWSEIERIKQEGASFEIKLWPDSQRSPTDIPGYRIGDFLTLNIEAGRDCYVTIFDFTTSGTIHVLFPNSFVTNNRLKGGRTYKFPDEQDGFKIRVKGPPGIERLKVFATTQKVPLFAENYAKESFRSVTRESYSVSRDLEAVIDSLAGNSWAEVTLELRIEQTLRNAAE